MNRLTQLYTRVKSKLYRKETGYQLNYLTLQVKNPVIREAVVKYRISQL